MVRSGRRTLRPVMRRPSNAWGEVTSCTRCKSIYSSVGSPGASRTTWASQIFSNKVRAGIRADEVYNERTNMKRRALLRVLGVGGLASLVAACTSALPRADDQPTLAPTPLPPPTVAPTELPSVTGIRLAIDQDPD